MSPDDLIPLVAPDESDPRIQAALSELRAIIAAHYPEAEFAVYRGEDPDGIYLRAIVDVADLDEVTEVFIDRLVDFEVEEGLPVYVALDWPTARVQEYLRRRATESPLDRIPVAWP